MSKMEQVSATYKIYNFSFCGSVYEDGADGAGKYAYIEHKEWFNIKVNTDHNAIGERSD